MAVASSSSSSSSSSTTATQIPRSVSGLSGANPNLTPRRKAAFGFRNYTYKSMSSTRSLAVLAFKSQDDQLNLDTDNPHPLKDDLDYLLKLGGGSVLGAAAIKYGSILLPEITRPNIVLALAMISAPVVVAILLLINESRKP